MKGKSDDALHPDNFCTVHRVCQTAGCTDRVHDDPINPARTRCYRHFCTFGLSCPEERAFGGSQLCTVCLKHKCSVPNCTHRITPGGGDLCIEHQCTSSTCQLARFHPYKFCINHVCRANLMPGLANQLQNHCEEEGDAFRNFRCRKHVDCSEPGCDNFCTSHNGVLLKKCDFRRFSLPTCLPISLKDPPAYLVL